MSVACLWFCGFCAACGVFDNGATEQVFGHIKDELFRGRTWPDFESFKADLDAISSIGTRGGAGLN